jgi:large subunit ribosomal protein L4
VATVSVIDQAGARTGELELPDAIFGGPINTAVMHQALIRQLANARQGTHDTKTRTEVRGGGKKPWRQKGTGRARQGSIRSPQWAGGGIVFGPTPRSHRQDMPRKQRRLALRSALAAKAQDGQISVLGAFELDAPRTRVVVDLLRTIEAGARCLVVLGSHNELLERSARNLAEVRVVLAANLSVRDLLTADTVLMTRDALEHVEGAWS